MAHNISTNDILVTTRYLNYNLILQSLIHSSEKIYGLIRKVITFGIKICGRLFDQIVYLPIKLFCDMIEKYK